MSAQDRGTRLALLALLNVEGVVHAARRVIARHVEGFEVVPVGLDVLPFGDLEAEPDEDVFEAFPRLRDDMRVASPWARRDLGEIDSFCGQLHHSLGLGELAPAPIEAFGHGCRGLVDRLPGRALLVDRCQLGEA